MPYTTLNTAKEMPFPKSSSMSSRAGNKNTSPLNILLVEDDDSDVTLTETALDAMNMDYNLYILRNGTEVLPYLYRQGKYYNKLKPDVLLLDLSLPTKDGFEVLAELASHDDSFHDIPIIILTGDTHSAFLKHSYELNVVGYFTKPCSAEKINNMLMMIGKKTH